MGPNERIPLLSSQKCLGCFCASVVKQQHRTSQEACKPWGGTGQMGLLNFDHIPWGSFGGVPV